MLRLIYVGQYIDSRCYSYSYQGFMSNIPSAINSKCVLIVEANYAYTITKAIRDLHLTKHLMGCIILGKIHDIDIDIDISSFNFYCVIYDHFVFHNSLLLNIISKRYLWSYSDVILLVSGYVSDNIVQAKLYIRHVITNRFDPNDLVTYNVIMVLSELDASYVVTILSNLKSNPVRAIGIVSSLSSCHFTQDTSIASKIVTAKSFNKLMCNIIRHQNIS